MLERLDLDWADQSNVGYHLFAKHNLRLYEMAHNFLVGLGKKDFKIVDAAAGSGVGYDCLSPFGSYLGLDRSQEAVLAARAKRPHADYLVRDVEDHRTFRDLEGKVDLFVSFETAEHLINPNQFFCNIKHVLHGGPGYFFFSAPTCLTRDYDPYHLHDRTTKQWRETIIKAGFNVLHEQTTAFTCTFRQFCKTIPTTLAQKWQIAWFAMTHPRYLLDRLWNWIIRNRFSWSSQCFACQAA